MQVTRILLKLLVCQSTYSSQCLGRECYLQISCRTECFTTKSFLELQSVVKIVFINSYYLIQKMLLFTTDHLSFILLQHSFIPLSFESAKYTGFPMLDIIVTRDSAHYLLALFSSRFNHLTNVTQVEDATQCPLISMIIKKNLFHVVYAYIFYACQRIIHLEIALTMIQNLSRFVCYFLIIDIRCRHLKMWSFQYFFYFNFPLKRIKFSLLFTSCANSKSSA